jgi:hypothetical protein
MCKYITFSLTFHLGTDFPMCLFVSGVQPEILRVFLISPVNFSCPICRTVFQFTTNSRSVPIPYYEATHNSDCHYKTKFSFSPCSSTTFPCLVVGTQTQTHIIENYSMYQILFFYKYVLIFKICVNCLTGCTRYTVNNIETCNVCTFALLHNS